MKPLLAVSWEMPPMYGPRATQVSRALSALPSLGWSPTVVCLDPRRGGPHWPDGLEAPAIPGVERVRVTSLEESLAFRALARLAPSLRHRPDSARLWIPRAARAAASVVASRKPAVMITFAQPWSDHLIGLRVHRATPIPWVAHFSDPWIESPYLSAARREVWRPTEQAIIGAATAVVFTTEETADLVMRGYPAAWRGKVWIVPHGFDPDAVSASTAPAGTARPLRMLHAGRFYSRVRTPSAMLQALAAINRRAPLAGQIDVTFLGPHGCEFAREASALGIDTFVTFKGYVPPPEAARAAAGADVLLVIDAPSAGPSPFLPSKLVDYLPHRKPILGLTPEPGASARLLRRLGCPVAPPDDVDAIARAVEDLLRQWHTGTLRVGDTFDAVAATYDFRCTTRALHDVLTRACA